CTLSPKYSLKDTYYKQSHFINTKGRNDLVIHNSKDASGTVGVIIEAKKPNNKAEMLKTISQEDTLGQKLAKINVKAFHELILYYLRERITLKNIEIKYLIATNINEWFIFDATLFDRLFAQNKGLVKQFIDFEGGRLADIKTDFFYKQVAEPFVSGLTHDIEFTYFNIKDYEKALRNEDKQDDNQLISLFKLLSPEHLLKLPFLNDSNTLDKRFYGELLHIIGLAETKDGNKKIIGRFKAGERNPGSILENAIIQLDSLDKISRLSNSSQYGTNLQERLFNVGLELTITWINRILFLKLLEAQLVNYHNGDKNYEFLSIEKIKDYDDLNSLFFQVLARKHDERGEDIKPKFSKIPYLNSSLFEPTEIEHSTIFISNLRDDKSFPAYSSTVLKDDKGKKRSGNIGPLEYLFEFLNAYDFTSEGNEDIQEENKTLINASVLGLIFEKINGYKDGSFFTPGFITMYMCRETVRKSVVQKFNEIKGWNCTDFEKLYDKIEDRIEANKIINSIKICDPAVGSGHFLVSALNEMIAVKSDLKILQDRQGKRLKEYHFEVINDELIVTDEDGDLFEYKPTNKESQRIQETLFHEKQAIIENCLFGVDINPNSVKICRLRLWIELLKNAYYKNATELETLPNIDINIKCGNSLISRFALDADLKQALKKSASKWTIDSYRIAVDTYRNAQNKEQKREMERLINEIKTNFRSEISQNDLKVKRLYRLKNELFTMTEHPKLFELSNNEKNAWNKKVKELTEESSKLEKLIEEIKNNKIYENAFEWRFEFPEVLDDNGDFIGFDVVIGNPPYIRQEGIKELKPYLEENFSTFSGRADLYVYFYEKGVSILEPNGIFCFITPNKFFRANYGKALKTYLSSKLNIIKIIDFGELPVFDEASTFPMIFISQKSSNLRTDIEYALVKELESVKENVFNAIELYTSVLANDNIRNENWNLNNSDSSNLFNRLISENKLLKFIDEINLYSGIKTGYNDAFWINDSIKDKLVGEDPKSIEIIKPLCRGTDIRKWKVTNENLNIIFTHNDTLIDNYPAVKTHLLKFKEKLEQRAVKQPWWQLQQAQNRDGIWDKPKILYPDICKESRFTIDEKGIYSDMKGFVLTSSSKFLLAILNSKLIWWYLKKICAVLGDPEKGGRLQLKSQYIERIPIANCIDLDLKNKIESLVEKCIIRPDDCFEFEIQINELIYKLYKLSEEEIKIIEEN
ncbi:MAG TPA: type II restriction endonuclease, partial [Bacteroidales bacterium]|nr:type II restriction endonuclease [Bacteroidales bacterium]